MKKRNGFTFIEVMITITVIGIVVSVSTASLNASRAVQKLRTVQAEVASAVKMVQSYALQGKSQSAVVCGYGLRWKDDKTYAVYYANLSVDYSNCDQQNNNPARRHYVNSSSTPEIEIHTLPAGTFLNNYVGTMEIFFDIPHANIYDVNGASFLNPLTFTFGADGSSTTKSVVISGQALITAN